ncbi:ABC transporter substrate-binding protein [Verrucomicrobiaceae bacterium N1E253]|uniref:ABC transporter substrate-binding protein n=1 Tax=Oceaniferula marina TaxID=2748318 RepID=A0A851GE84_9BACT|nr:ABC transporter substrate-binding protein [Oceaniferula marina]NWK55736.1 ABC transporter substrate-binding protein [Oceaniferula marina]
MPFPTTSAASLICRCLQLATAVLLLGACSESDEPPSHRLDLKSFTPIYNQYIQRWLAEEHQRISKQIQELERSGKAQQPIDSKLLQSRREMERITYRQSLGDYFQFKQIDDLPEDLVWEDGMDQPEIGDPRAKKGGVFRYYITEFPPTVRPFGKESNNSFRGRLYDELEIHLTGVHPLTGKPIPGIAKRWAISHDQRTVYYELDPEARYNNGNPIKASDYMTGIYIRVSDNVASPFEKQYYREQFAQITSFGESHLAVTLPEPKPMMTYHTRLSPADPDFYQNYGPDFAERYQWKVAPHSGAYFVQDKDIRKGVSIKLTRNPDWWAKDHKYYRHLYNPDQIIYTTIRDASKAFELFRAGELDAFQLNEPKLWYEKSEIDPVFNGYIERYMFYTQFPRSPRGMYYNLDRPLLQDLNIRLGINHALHWQKVIDIIYRGDYARLQQFSEGFNEITRSDIRARPFSVIEARRHFHAAGFSEESPDGILRRPNGQRLAFDITYPTSGNYNRIIAILKEEARKAGLELRADGQEPTVSYKKVMKKEHDMTFWGWGCRPPFPSYHQFFHSSNAYSDNGEVKPQTNNINSFSNEQMDVLCEQIRNARTREEVKSTSHAIQQLIHDEAIFSPAWVANFVRIGSWRWVRWPNTKATPFNNPVISDPLESYVFWIDQDIQKQTQQAVQQGKPFPEVQRIIDQFKEGIPDQPKP